MNSQTFPQKFLAVWKKLQPPILTLHATNNEKSNWFMLLLFIKKNHSAGNSTSCDLDPCLYLSGDYPVFNKCKEQTTSSVTD